MDGGVAISANKEYRGLPRQWQQRLWRHLRRESCDLLLSALFPLRRASEVLWHCWHGQQLGCLLLLRQRQWRRMVLSVVSLFASGSRLFFLLVPTQDGVNRYSPLADARLRAFFKGEELVVGVVHAWRLDMARPFLGGGSRRW